MSDPPRVTSGNAEAAFEFFGWTVLVFPMLPLGDGGANEIGRKYHLPGSYGIPRPAKVLVVDDDFDTTETVRAMVQALGHECLTAKTGAQAIELCQEHHFDCMFLDARLGSLSGMAVAQRLGGSKSWLRPTHIVLLTGSPLEDFRSAPRERVVDSYLKNQQRSTA